MCQKRLDFISIFKFLFHWLCTQSRLLTKATIIIVNNLNTSYVLSFKIKCDSALAESFALNYLICSKASEKSLFFFDDFVYYSYLLLFLHVWHFFFLPLLNCQLLKRLAMNENFLQSVICIMDLKRVQKIACQLTSISM